MVAAVGAMVDRMGREITAAIGGMRTGLGERLEGLGSPGAAASKQAASRQGRKLCGRGWLACAAGVLEVAADLWLRQGGPATVRTGK